MAQSTQVDPSPRVALKQQAYNALKQLIISDQLPAGTVQSVRQLSARLGMSKTPVQAAIERLDAEGLVTLAPQQGVVVREMSGQDIVDHYQLRQAVESFVVRSLAGRLTSEQTELLRDNLARYRALAEGGDLAEIIRVDAEFHMLLCGFVGNRELSRVMQQLHDKVLRVIARSSRSFPDRISATYDEHVAIFDALVEGDDDRAAELVNEHFEQGLRRFWSSR